MLPLYFGGMGMYYGWATTSSIIIMVVSLIITIIAQINVKTTFAKYSKIKSHRGMTGRDAAEQILRYNGCSYVRLESIQGNLTDHYDPRSEVIRLSSSTENIDSIAAIGVAAHEAGHAVQYKEGYFPIKIRSALIPICNIGSQFSWIAVILGVAFSWPVLAYVGVLLFAFAVIFQLITLPVEFNASSRAIKALGESNILTDEEIKGAKKVLTAAALTYVAALATSILQLIRLLLIARRSNN